MNNNSLGRRLWTALLTGVPFGVYKYGFGWYEYHHSHEVIGLLCMVWGAIDIALNLISLFKCDRLGYCLLENIGATIDRLLHARFWRRVLLAVDTTLAFVIVSVMIWTGRLPLEPQLMGHIWNIAVIGNVMAVGLEQLYRALTKSSAR